MAALLNWFRALAPREQKFVQLGVVACATLLLFAALLPFERKVAKLEQRVQAKQADLAWLKTVAPQLAAMRSAPAGAGGESLVVLADRVARETGIARSLTGSLPSGDGALSVRLESVAFDALANWAAELVQHHGVQVVSASIDSGSASGVVSATFVLRNP